MDMNLIFQPEKHSRFSFSFHSSNQTKPVKINYEETALVSFDQAMEPLIQIYSHFEQMNILVKERCQRNDQYLSSDEIASIMIYTIEWLPGEQSFYSLLNQQLSSSEPIELASWYLYLKLFSIALDKLPRIGSRQIFYRTISKECLFNEICFWNEYISCQTAFHQTNDTLVLIHTNQAVDIQKYSFYPHEKDILIPFGKQYQVVSRRQGQNPSQLLIIKEITPIPLIIENKSSLSNENLEKRLKKYEKFAEINLRNANLFDSQMNLIVQYAFKEKQCSWLSLQNNYLTSSSLLILSDGFQVNPYLQTLHLSENYLNNLGIFYLTKIINKKFSNLTFLNLNSNYIEDEGVEYLAKMLKTNGILADLWLSNNRFGNLGVQCLAEVLTSDNRSLVQLYLNKNPLVTDQCISSIIQMLETNETLNTFWLSDCNLTQHGKEMLAKSIEDRESFDLDV